MQNEKHLDYITAPDRDCAERDGE